METNIREMTDNPELVGLGNAQYYAKHYSSREAEFYAPILSEIVLYGRPGPILDAGCGVGLFLELASRWGMPVMGCDGSRDAVAAARIRCPHLRVECSLLSKMLPFEDGSFGNILLNQVIEHLPPPVLANVLKESRRVLMARGMLFVYSPSLRNKAEIAKDPTHCNPQLPSTLRSLLVGEDFEVLQEPNSLRFLAQNPIFRRLAVCWPATICRDFLSATANAYARRRE